MMMQAQSYFFFFLLGLYQILSSCKSGSQWHIYLSTNCQRQVLVHCHLSQNLHYILLHISKDNSEAEVYFDSWHFKIGAKLASTGEVISRRSQQSGAGSVVQVSGNRSQGTTKVRECSLAERCLDSDNRTTTVTSAKKSTWQNHAAEATASDGKGKRDAVTYNPN